MTTRRSTVLVLGTADWDATLPTNQHSVAREIARVADVLFVESMGLRRPELTRRDLGRMSRRLVTAATGSSGLSGRPRPDSMVVRSGVGIPLHRPWTAPVNRRVLERLAAPWLRLPAADRVLWTYTPVTLGLESRARTTVYHCVDLLGAYPGVDAAAVDRGERALARAGALAVGSSPAVVAHLRRQGFAEVLHWPNVADTGLFEAAARPAAEREPGLVVLAGNLSPHKIDCRMLQALLDVAPTSTGAPHLELVLAGPVAEGGGSRWAGLDALLASGAHLAGTLSPPALAELLGRASVGVIPYATTPYTSGVDPLKRYEYLAAGLPVVASGLACVDPVADAIWCADSPASFAARTLDLLGGPSTGEIAARQDLARDHSWSRRGRQVRDLLGLELPVGPELERQLP